MKRVVRSLKRRRTIGARLEILLRQQRRRFLNSSTIFLLSNLLQVRRTNSITNNFYASISIFILRKILSAPKIVIILPRRNRNRSSISIVSISHEWNTKFYRFLKFKNCRNSIGIKTRKSAKSKSFLEVQIYFR